MLKQFRQHRRLVIVCILVLVIFLIIGLYFRPRTFKSISPTPVSGTEAYFSGIYGEHMLSENLQDQIVTLLSSCAVRRALGTPGIDYRIMIYDNSGANIAELTFGETAADCSIFIRTDGIELKRFVLTKRSDKESFSELYEQLKLLSGR